MRVRSFRFPIFLGRRFGSAKDAEECRLLLWTPSELTHTANMFSHRVMPRGVC